eukprot:TRINITY_DN742_c0_g1_i2.p3 TRINITY_DN742_c0_g1~~TRINITY_DN742_c0_g1_i2.p3  ORF type:complete len:139 (+),score=22.09 TRINITY_DN742_c0_g1_i2:108-524(+)
MVEQGTTLPFLTESADILRHGPVKLRGELMSVHPVQKIQKHNGEVHEKEMREMLRHAYGIALPTRMAIERSILDGCERLPCLPSSKLGLDIMTGKLNEFEFEDILDLPDSRTEILPDIPSMMEARLGINTNFLKRGMF